MYFARFVWFIWKKYTQANIGRVISNDNDKL